MKHKTLTFMLAVLMNMVANVASAYDTVKDGIYYNLGENEAEVAGANANMLTGGMVIPEQITYGGKVYKITSIAPSAFENTDITSISIPQSISAIGESAFNGCSKLTKAYFSSIEHICNIERANNTSNPLFYAHHLYINNKEITSITIPASVEKIKSWAFEGCTFLTSINIEYGVISIEQSAFYGDIGIKSIIIPESVIAIGPQAFQNCIGLTSISIPNSVTLIDNHAFRGCTGIKDVSIGESITTIGQYAFYSCTEMERCELKGHVQEIGESAFENCKNLMSIHLPKDINIPSKLFSGCISLSSVLMEDGIGEISNEAFKNCSSLQSIKLPSSVNSIGDAAFEGCSTLKSIDLSEQLKSIGSRTFSGCEKLREIIIPAYVMSIGDGAFDGCKNLSMLILEDGESTINLGHAGEYYKKNTIEYYPHSWGYVPLYVTEYNGLFSDAALKYIYIGRSLTYNQYDTDYKKERIPGKDDYNEYYYLYLYNSPFNRALTLEKIIIGRDVSFLGTGVRKTLSYSTNKQHTSSVKYYIEPDIFGALAIGEVYSMNTNAPLYANFSSDTYNNSNLFILEGSLSSYSNTDGWKEFNNINEFDPHNVTAITLNKNRHEFGWVGEQVQLTSQIYPEGAGFMYIKWKSSDGTICTVENGTVTATGYGTANVTVTCIDYNNKSYTATCEIVVERKEERGFNYEYLGSEAKVVSKKPEYSGDIIIPDYTTLDDKTYLVTSIKPTAFKNSTDITSVVIGNNVTSVGDYAFSGCTGLTSISIGNSVTEIGNYAFFNCTGLNSVTIGNSLTSIGTSVFQGCIGLTSVIIPNSVTEIGNYAFFNCTGLSSVTIGNSLTSIGTSVFQGCIGLTSVIIPNSVTEIGGSAFSGCTGLTSISIGNSVTEIGDYAFFDCIGLASVTLPNNVTSIGDYAFYDCAGLASVTIGNSLTSVGTSVFEGCAGLTSFIIPENVTSIGHHAFQDCTSLIEIRIPENVEVINTSAFEGCSNLNTLTLFNKKLQNISGDVFNGCTALSKIYCEYGTPPSITSTTFEETHYLNAQLFVPKGCTKNYKVQYWENFLNINEFEAASVSTINEKTSMSSGLYNINGWEQRGLSKGLNIFRHSDGKTKKVLVK